jgi:hypothetical protein
MEEVLCFCANMALLDAPKMGIGGNSPTEVYLNAMPFGTAKIWLPRIVHRHLTCTSSFDASEVADPRGP